MPETIQTINLFYKKKIEPCAQNFFFRDNLLVKSTELKSSGFESQHKLPFPIRNDIPKYIFFHTSNSTPSYECFGPSLDIFGSPLPRFAIF